MYSSFLSHIAHSLSSCFFFFNDTATTEIYTLSLHDALPICVSQSLIDENKWNAGSRVISARRTPDPAACSPVQRIIDRKSTRLNSSHLVISYAVFCLKKKKQLMALYHLMLHSCPLPLAHAPP